MYFSNKTTFCLGLALILFLSCADNSDVEFPSKDDVRQRYSSSEDSSSSSKESVSSSSYDESSSSTESSSSSELSSSSVEPSSSSSSSSLLSSNSNSEPSSSSIDSNSSSSSLSPSSSSSEPSNSSSSSVQSSSSVSGISSSSVEPSSSSPALCGSTGQIPTASQFCYENSTIKNKCGGETYNAQEFCGQDEKVYTLCGSLPYPIDTHFCLNGEITPKCGGKLTYDPWQFCYDGLVKPRCKNSPSGNTYIPGTEECCVEKKYNLSTQRCNDSDIVETKCGDGWYDASNDDFKCRDDVVKKKCGNKWYDISNNDLDCQGNVIVTKCGNGWYDASKKFCDNRDYKIYKYTIIGSQTWMAENLNYYIQSYYSNAKCAEKIENSSWLNNTNTIYCDTYGRLYNWNIAKNGNVCPDGWHLPTALDWNTLMNFINLSCLLEGFDDCANAGIPLRATSGWGSHNGTDIHGFTALPAGYGDYGYQQLSNFGIEGSWWSADDGEDVSSCGYGSGNCAYVTVMNNGNDDLSWWRPRKSEHRSVRCIKNN